MAKLSKEQMERLRAKTPPEAEGTEEEKDFDPARPGALGALVPDAAMPEGYLGMLEEHKRKTSPEAIEREWQKPSRGSKANTQARRK